MNLKILAVISVLAIAACGVIVIAHNNNQESADDTIYYTYSKHSPFFEGDFPESYTLIRFGSSDKLSSGMSVTIKFTDGSTTSAVLQSDTSSCFVTLYGIAKNVQSVTKAGLTFKEYGH